MICNSDFCQLIIFFIIPLIVLLVWVFIVISKKKSKEEFLEHFANVIDEQQYDRINKLEDTKIDTEVDFNKLRDDLSSASNSIQQGKARLEQSKREFDTEKAELSTSLNTILDYNKTENRKCENRAELGSFNTSVGNCAKICSENDGCYSFYHNKDTNSCNLSRTCFDGNYVVDDEKTFDFYFKKNYEGRTPELSNFNRFENRSCSNRADLATTDDNLNECAKKCNTNSSCQSFSVGKDGKCIMSKSCVPQNATNTDGSELYTKNDTSNISPLAYFNKHQNNDCAITKQLASNANGLEQCADACHNEAGCVSFIHNPSTNSCTLTKNCYSSLGRIPNNETDFYSKTTLSETGVGGSRTALQSQELRPEIPSLVNIPNKRIFNIQSLGEKDKCLGVSEIKTGRRLVMQNCDDRDSKQDFSSSDNKAKIMMHRFGDNPVCLQRKGDKMSLEKCQSSGGGIGGIGRHVMQGIMYDKNNQYLKMRGNRDSDVCLISNGIGKDVSVKKCSDLTAEEEMNAKWYLNETDRQRKTNVEIIKEKKDKKSDDSLVSILRKTEDKQQKPKPSGDSIVSILRKAQEKQQQPKLKPSGDSLVSILRKAQEKQQKPKPSGDSLVSIIRKAQEKQQQQQPAQQVVAQRTMNLPFINKLPVKVPPPPPVPIEPEIPIKQEEKPIVQEKPKPTKEQQNLALKAIRALFG